MYNICTKRFKLKHEYYLISFECIKEKHNYMYYKLKYEIGGTRNLLNHIRPKPISLLCSILWANS